MNIQSSVPSLPEKGCVRGWGGLRTWYNALVEDAKLPEKDRRTWTKFGPKPDAQYHEAGLIGPVACCRPECAKGPVGR